MLKRIGAEEGGEFKAIASGTLPNGKPVVVNADGTVSVVSQTSASESVGTGTIFETGNTAYPSCTYDSAQNKSLIVWSDGSSSYEGQAAVATISGTSVSFGSVVTWASGNKPQYMDSAYDVASGKHVIVYRDSNNSNKGTAVVATVSGTSVSFGTPVIFNNAETEYTIVEYDASSQKVVVAYKDQGNSSYATAIVGTVSGTSISFGSEVVFQSTNSNTQGITYDSGSSKIIIGYRKYDSFMRGFGVVGTVSGTSISFGTPVRFDTTNTSGHDIDYISVAYDSNQDKTLFAYRGISQYGQVNVATVSGTSISFGSVATFNSAQSTFIDAVYHPLAQKVFISYTKNTSSDHKKILPATISSTSATFGSEATLLSDQTIYGKAAYDSSSKVLLVVYRGTSNDRGYASVYQAAYSENNLTSENYIGMSGGPTGVTEAQTQAIGTPASYYTTAGTAYTTAVFDSNSNKVVFSFRGNGDDGTSIVGTVDPSNNSMSFGSAVVWNTDESIYIKSAFDSNSNKVVIVYRDEGNSQYGTAVVGTVSGNSISFGSDVVFESAAVDHLDVAFDSNSNKVVIVFRDRGDDFDGKAIVGTVSGTSISFGSAAVFNDGAVAANYYMNAVFDSNSNKVVVGWANPGKAKVGTVSGTSISFGSVAEFESGNIDHFSSAFDSSNNKVVYAYRDEGNSNYGTAVVGTVSGTSISFGTPVVFESAVVSGTGTTFDTTTNKINIFYTDDGNSGYATVIVGTVSGTSISFGTPVAFENEDSGQYGATFDSNSNRAVCGYNGNSSRGTSIVFKNAGDYPVTGQVTNGQAASIDIIGSVSDNQGSLTAGQQYYVQTDGTISTTAGSPSVLAGTAISATELVVKT